MIAYLTLASLSLIIFFAIYWFFLREFTFFQWNRFYLLATLIVSALIPLAQFVPWGIDNSYFTYFITDQPESITIADDGLSSTMQIDVAPPTITEDTTYRTAHSTLRLIYWTGVAASLLWLVIRLYSAYRLSTSDTAKGNFSFFGNIRTSGLSNGTNIIYQHETIHAQQHHSIDILLAELVAIFFWFHPLLFLYRRELKIQHELIADHAISCDKVAYAESLVAQAMRISNFDLRNSFSNQSLLKRRITMLFKHNTKTTQKVTYLFSVPVLLIVAFSAVHLSATEHKVADADVLLAPTTTATQNTTHAKESKESDNTSTHVRPNIIHTDTTYTSVDVSPEPEGGMTNFRKWIGDNFVYPQAAIDAEVKGVIQATFIVMGDGTLSDITIENGLGYGTEEATVNLLKKSPKWTPGLQKGRAVNVRFMLPIRLDLSAPSDTTTVIKKENFSLNKMASGDLESPVGPRPAEGMPAFRKWIADNFPFPQEAIDEGVKGTVEVSFIVETDGQITELKIDRDLGYGTGEAAIALMKKAPKWLPAVNKDSQPVRVAYKLPIRLDLSGI